LELGSKGTENRRSEIEIEKEKKRGEPLFFSLEPGRLKNVTLADGECC
jgi:hypothetical protein